MERGSCVTSSYELKEDPAYLGNRYQIAGQIPVNKAAASATVSEIQVNHLHALQLLGYDRDTVLARVAVLIRLVRTRAAVLAANATVKQLPKVSISAVSHESQWD